jgi:hypothetical protein
MAFVTNSLPIYPDVPAVAGVPALNRAINVGVSDVLAAELLAEQVVGNFGLIAPSWGIYNNAGAVALDPDSFIGIEFHKDYDIPTYKIEQGGFASYNKVTNPFTARVTMAIGQTTALRAGFLSAVAALCDSTDLVTIVTPEVSYPSANISQYEYRRRESNGSTLLVVELMIQEIRISTDTMFSSTAAPNGAGQVSGGTVQPTTPSASAISSYNANYQPGAVTQTALP